MSRPDSPRIAKCRLLGRADLSGPGVETIHAGRSIKANLLSLDLGDRPLVVKDFGAKAWWVRWIGRLQIARECRAYRNLAGIEGVPEFFGCIDPWALVLERVNGRPLGIAPERAVDGQSRFRQLSEIVSRIHARGVLHLDLRARRNVLVRSDGRVFVLDFASAIRLRPGGLLHRVLFGVLSATDRSALLKWKRMLGAGPLSAQEQRQVERHRRWHAWWPFNKKER